MPGWVLVLGLLLIGVLYIGVSLLSVGGFGGGHAPGLGSGRLSVQQHPVELQKKE